mmetsp:Transcript_10755/g.36497  ORF Transcript_10755/g.36497 Transcript_10755/m.36497 type:complete len:201 (+) Transcript_10755:425-1027(+)
MRSSAAGKHNGICATLAGLLHRATHLRVPAALATAHKVPWPKATAMDDEEGAFGEPDERCSLSSPPGPHPRDPSARVPPSVAHAPPPVPQRHAAPRCLSPAPAQQLHRADRSRRRAYICRRAAEAERPKPRPTISAEADDSRTSPTAEARRRAQRSAGAPSTRRPSARSWRRWRPRPPCPPLPASAPGGVGCHRRGTAPS